MKRSDEVQHIYHRTYLIRWTTSTLDKPNNRFWVEKHDQFICWADTLEEAQRRVDRRLA